MKPHVSGITLGVKDMNRAKQFYSKGLGWPIQQDYQGQWVSFSLNNGSSTLGPRPLDTVAGGPGVAPGRAGVRGIAVSYDRRPKERGGAVLARSKRASGPTAQPAPDARGG